MEKTSPHTYRTTLERPAAPGLLHTLHLEGLDVGDEVLLNDERLLTATNAFVDPSVDVTDRLRPGSNEVTVKRGDLDAALAEKRPRPRHRTRLVSHTNLRWLRTPLLGQIPAWSSTRGEPAPRARLESSPLHLEGLHLTAQLTDLKSRSGLVRLEARVRGPLQAAALYVGAQTAQASVSGDVIRLELALEAVPLWWPHTHGEPTLLPAQLLLTLTDGRTLEHPLNPLGFKHQRFTESEGFVFNGVPVLARGVCWTPSPQTELRGVLTRARDAGLNMIRVGGTMGYESDAFYELCDELGIAVWQDFAFANQDYPIEDLTFRAEVEREARHQLKRLSRHACLAAYCGNSEVAQQAAMMGLPPQSWSNVLFDELLPQSCEALHPGLPYFPSSPHSKNALPFRPDQGITHYYGVGAYRRPLTDVKHAGVRFASECLGIANLPEPEGPDWQASTARDSGSDYDFADVRDFYLHALTGEDPAALRAQDMKRYLALSRHVSGQVMKTVFAEWRNPTNPCRGGLVWFLRDLEPGSGWGVLDCMGAPKPAWHALAQAWAPRAVLFTDEGLNGLHIHLHNDSPEPWEGTLQLRAFAQGRTRVLDASRTLTVPPHGSLTFSADELLGHFADLVGAYRFGPLIADAVHARFADAEDSFFPAWLRPQNPEGIKLRAHPRGDGAYTVRVQSPLYLQGLRVHAPGYTAPLERCDLPPGEAREWVFVPTGDTAPFKVTAEALNLTAALEATPT